ncbi:MAG TPA: hypothetical protein VGX25_09380 [Actinophytocola sp.]|uniref:AMIN-like domain-containing (lipo)protein n=1 Tax=Actinophytocola sp. TaxID=1872138 RepID=UPI002DDD5DF0|nr:hypothetical protein [Actinophytocola sp.]HEV2779599.1 hypothetical protein [Actinophytocola sp.]
MAALVVLVGLVPVSASATDEYCGITWGSGVKSGPQDMGGNLVGLRAGRGDCYDTLVFDVQEPVGGYWVSYVDEVFEDPTGAPVPLRGGAKLVVTVYASAFDESGRPTYSYANRAELLDVTGFPTFRQMAWAGSFEGTTSVGLGVRARLPFRVFTLPGRVVVDVAHFW